MKWLKKRLKEVSTYVGAGSLIQTLVLIPEPTTQAIAAVIGIAGILLPDETKDAVGALFKK